MIREWKDSTLKRFINEGRGSGEGKEYKSWLQVQDVKSQGRSTRLFSYKTQRVMHLLSDLQLYYFYLLEFDNQVIDIREHYPLLDFHEQDISLDEKLKRKLFNAKTNVPHILTVPFLVTKLDSQQIPYYEARVIKSSSELEKPSTIERFELIRRYCNKKNIDFGIVTEKEINKQLARNISWILTAYDISTYSELVGNYHSLKIDMVQLFSFPNITFQEVFTKIEKNYQLPEGSALILFKHLLATKQLHMDINTKIELSDCVSLYDIQWIEMDGEDRAVSS